LPAAKAPPAPKIVSAPAASAMVSLRLLLFAMV
jgi:hypothetical protein